MKIQRTEFKSIIKECLKELITEGALDHMVTGLVSERTNQAYNQSYLNDPRVKMAAAQIAGGNPQQTQMMEQILADTAMNSLPDQQAAMNRLPNGMPMPGAIGGMQQDNMLNEYGSPNGGHSLQRNPLPPREAQRQQSQSSGAASRWASLAFNSPISNRPQSGAGGSSGGFLPGAKKGSFE